MTPTVISTLTCLGTKGLPTLSKPPERLCAQRRYGVFHSRNVRSVRYRPACNVPAAQHQLRVVQFFQRRLFFRERLHHAAGSVIQQHHDMRRFQRRAPAHGKARRNTLHNGIFAGTHQRCGRSRRG